METRRSYGQYCPVAKATEILADRWTPLIIREFLYEVHRFNDLERGLPGISRTLLSQRLRRLQSDGIVERRLGKAGPEYRLTEAGRALRGVIRALGEWGATWALPDPRRSELDPALLLWWMRRRVDGQHLPTQRVVVQFIFPTARRRTIWLVLQPGDVSVCLEDPRFDVDLVVTADLAQLYRVWFGRATFEEAVAGGFVTIEGSRSLTRAFPGWFLLSPFAPLIREHQTSSLRHSAAAMRSASGPGELTTSVVS